MNKSENINFLIVDLFCGAGGTTTGFAQAELEGNSIAKVIACVNHDPKAIKSHWMNHPEVKHFEEDIRTLDLAGLIEVTRLARDQYPDAHLILWASLECTNFSKAKGGQPRDADSRTLADHLERYITALDPEYIQIENVVEFMSWGPLDERGKPISKKSGSDWLRWRKEVCDMGYNDEWKELNSADFGAYTSRNRLFGCFAKPHLQIVWPEPTHSKNPTSNTTLFGSLQKWKPVKDVLDFDDEGQSIFNRKKDLSPKTLERIYAGLIKYVAGGKENFILKYNSTSKSGKHTPPSVDDPCPVISTQVRLGVVKTSFIQKHNSGDPYSKVTSVDNPAGSLTTACHQSVVNTSFIQKYFSGKPEGKVTSVNSPAGTIATAGGQALVQPQYLMNYHHSSDVNSIDNPCPTLTTRDKIAIVHPSFLMKYHGTGSNISSIEDPASTITTKDRLAKVWIDKTYGGDRNHQSVEQPAGVIMTNDKHQLVQTVPWLDRNFSGGGKHSPIDKPAGSLMTVPKMNLVNAKPFLMNTSYGNVGRSIEEPAPPLLASRRHHYIVNPSHGGHSTSIDAPCPVIIARQDKAPLYLIQVEYADVCIPVYDDDPPIMVDIKIFMALYGISDIKMRMLKILELLLIQGFPVGYFLFGNQSDQKKFIGNSVHPYVPKKWAEAFAIKFRELNRQVA